MVPRMAPASANAHDLHDGRDLVEQVRRSLQGVVPERREASLQGWVASLRANADLPRLVSLLAGAPETELRDLALRLAPNMAAPFKRPVRSVLRRLLADRALPEPPQLTMAATLLQQSPQPNAGAQSTLRALVKGLRKSQAVERLRRLEAQVGSTPAVAAMRARYESKIKMTCPRCRERLSRQDMVKHLWTSHKLLVLGTKVRRPWSLIGHWLEEYRRQGSEELLTRSRLLAQHVDGNDGLRHFHRLALIHHIDDRTARQALLDEAAQQRGSLCPHCFALLPFWEEKLVEPLSLGDGGIEGHGFRVRLSEQGVLTRLLLHAPGGYHSESHEPRRLLTLRGATVLFAGPFVVMALLLSVEFLLRGRSALAATLCLLLAAFCLALAARLWWRPLTQPLSRAVDYAWTLLAPRLHAGGYSPRDSAFLAGLALVSAGRGRPRLRSTPLLKAIEITEQAVAVGSGPVAHLGALWHLAVEDAAWGGIDPIAFVVTQAARCLDGKLPLIFAEQLFTGWETKRLSPAQRARLCVSLADAAFEAGCEIRDLIQLGKTAPAFGAVLGTDRLDYLAQLRLLWSLRPTRPWSSCGAAATVFELAGSAEAGHKHLAKHGDLLLALWDIPGGFLCGRGLLFHEVLFPEPPGTLEVKARSFLQGGGFELIVGNQRFWFQTDPAPLVVRLERWFRYYFREFRPRADGVFGWPSQAHFDPTRFHPLVKCPECRRRVQLRVGQVGIAAQ